MVQREIKTEIIGIRITKRLRTAIEREAIKQHRTMSQMAALLLESAFEEMQRADRR